MIKAVFGLANNDAQANRIVDHLLSSGFSNSDISILYPNHTQNVQSANRGQAEGWKQSDKKNHVNIETNTKASEGAAAGATAGGVLGGSLGLLAGIGALAIPGLGPFIAAGPIMAALSGSAIGGSLGLLIGALVGYGIPEHEARAYEKGLREGNILISVHADNDEEIHRAHDILKQEGAKDISTSQEKTRSY